MIKHIVFAIAEFYTFTYAIYELKHGNREGFVGVVLAVIFSLALFAKYST